MLFTILAILPGAINLICMHGFRIIPKSVPITFDLPNQIARSVVGIPADAIDKRKTFNETYRYLGAKFGRGSCLATFDRPNMGL